VSSQLGRNNTVSSSEPAEFSDAGGWNGGSAKWSVLGIHEFLVRSSTRSTAW